MRKIVSKLFNRRTFAVILLLVIFAGVSFFLIPVSDQKLVSGPWCGIGDNGVAELSFSREGSFVLTERDVSTNLASAHYESGIWTRDGRWQLQINSIIESSNQQRHQTY
jgi:hypothetical protein